jgi:hypothetical protein
MRTWTALAAAALFALVTLAGCAGKAPAPPADSIASGAQQLDLQATATTGVIRGVVVDDAIRPIDNATVTLQGTPPQTTKTNNLGAFGFDGLAAGSYFVQVHKRGFQDTQSSADVVAGVKDPAVVKILLAVKPGSLPSYDVFHFAGFLECNFVIPFFFFPCEVPGTPASNPMPVGNDDFSATYNMTGNISWIHTSLIWQPTEAVGTELYMNIGTPQTEIVGYTGGPSPQVVDVSGKDLDQFQNGALVIEVSGNGEQGLAGAEVEQGFDAYIVVFHNFEPPAGYAFYKDGEPTPPQ